MVTDKMVEAALVALPSRATHGLAITAMRAALQAAEDAAGDVLLHEIKRQLDGAGSEHREGIAVYWEREGLACVFGKPQRIRELVDRPPLTRWFTIGVQVPNEIEPKLAELVGYFSQALAQKLFFKQQAGRSGWREKGWMDECREALRKHVAKGDPLDVAAYAMFLWFHGERTSSQAAAPARTPGSALDLFVRAACVCDTSIDPRGYQWSEAYLDQALAAARDEERAAAKSAGAAPRPGDAPVASDYWFVRDAALGDGPLCRGTPSSDDVVYAHGMGKQVVRLYAAPVSAPADARDAEDAELIETLRIDRNEFRELAGRNERDARRHRLIRRGQHFSVIDGAGNTLRADELDAAADRIIDRAMGASSEN